MVYWGFWDLVLGFGASVFGALGPGVARISDLEGSGVP